MVGGTAGPCSETEGITHHEQSIQRRKTEGAIQKGAIDVYDVVPQRGGDSFFDRFAAARETHNLGPVDSSNQIAGEAFLGWSALLLYSCHRHYSELCHEVPLQFGRY